MIVFIAAEARADLLQIDSYIAERNPATADSLAEAINKKFENLLHFPFIGRDRSDLGPGLRSIVADHYVIFYMVEVNRLTIVRVLDGRRDIDAEFLR